MFRKDFEYRNMEVVVSYIKAIYLDIDKCCDEFVRGVESLEQCSIDESVEFFKRAFSSVPDSHKLFPKYKSYYGFSSLLSGKEDAISLCRGAAKSCPFDGDICMTLARAEIFLGNRCEALDVIKTGLRFSVGHDGLQQLKINMGVRKRKPLPFVSRNNLISVALGKRMRKKR